MKERIRQILREETYGLNPEVSAAYKMMNKLTKDCLWYYDTPEQRFEYSPECIWLINPNTKQWMLQLIKSGDLFYSHKIYPTFRKYFNMELSDFQSFIKLWVEDALKRGVSTTAAGVGAPHRRVEDALKRGVSKTMENTAPGTSAVEDALKKGKELR